MKTVIFGAGKIGRGFLAELVARSGGEITFVDAYAPLVEALRQAGKYPLLLTGETGWERTEISGFHCIPGVEKETVAHAVAEADLIFTAVGLANLQGVSPLLAAGLALRDTNVNILVCENGMEAVPILRESTLALLPPGSGERFGFAEVSVGRMVPVAPGEYARTEPLLVCAEPYYQLPVYGDALRCPLPAIDGIRAVSPFALILERKLYMQNMSHAVCAYLGARLGYETIWQAMGDERIRQAVNDALLCVAKGLSMRHQTPIRPLTDHGEELLCRYENRLLGDTIARVGRDTKRKLAPTDRLCGALSVCDGDCRALCAAIAAAFLFTGDAASDEVAAFAARYGVRRALETYCNMTDEDTVQTVGHLYDAWKADPEATIRNI